MKKYVNILHNIILLALEVEWGQGNVWSALQSSKLLWQIILVGDPKVVMNQGNGNKIWINAFPYEFCSF